MQATPSGPSPTQITEPGQDVRSVISTIEGLNGLDGAYLQIGQTLSIPDAGDT